MLDTVLNKSWKQHHIKQQLYDHWSPILQAIQVGWEKHAGHYWRSKNEVISDVLQWTTTHGHTSVGGAAQTYIYLLCANTGCHLEDLPRAMIKLDGWWERVKRIYAAYMLW